MKYRLKVESYEGLKKHCPKAVSLIHSVETKDDQVIIEICGDCLEALQIELNFLMMHDGLLLDQEEANERWESLFEIYSELYQ